MNMLERPHKMVAAAKANNRRELEKLVAEDVSLWSFKSAMQSVTLAGGGNVRVLRTMLSARTLDKASPAFAEVMEEAFGLACIGSKTKPEVLSLLRPYVGDSSQIEYRNLVDVFKKVADAGADPRLSTVRYLARNGGNAVDQAFREVEAALLAEKKRIEKSLAGLKGYKNKAGI